MTGPTGGRHRTPLVERRGPVGWLTLNRPEAGNAGDAVMLDDLEHLTSVWGHPDQEEGPRAFMEKRPPRRLPPVPDTADVP